MTDSQSTHHEQSTGGTERSNLQEMSEHPALVNQCTHCGCYVTLDRHLQSINGRYYAVCYSCSGDTETEQATLVAATDGGTSRSADTSTDQESNDE